MISAPKPSFTAAEQARFKPFALAIINKKQPEETISRQLGAEYPRFQIYLKSLRAQLATIKREKMAAQPSSSSSVSDDVMPTRFTDSEISEFHPIVTKFTAAIKAKETELSGTRPDVKTDLIAKFKAELMAEIKAQLGAKYPRFLEYVRKAQSDVRSKQVATRQSPSPSSASTSYVAPIAMPSSSALSDDYDYVSSITDEDIALFQPYLNKYNRGEMTGPEIYFAFGKDRGLYDRFLSYAEKMERCRNDRIAIGQKIVEIDARMAARDAEIESLIAKSDAHLTIAADLRKSNETRYRRIDEHEKTIVDSRSSRAKRVFGQA